jgi:hypothetical protein
MYDSCHTSLSSHACSVHPDVISTQRDIDGLQKEVDSEDGTADRLRQLTQAKGDLANAEEKYSAEHPDVIRLKHLVETLEKAVQDDANAGLKQTANSHPDSPADLQVKGALDAATVDPERRCRRADPGDSDSAFLRQTTGRPVEHPDAQVWSLGRGQNPQSLGSGPAGARAAG